MSNKTSMVKDPKFILVDILMSKIKDHLRKLPKNIREVEVTKDWLYNELERNNWSCPIMKVEFPLLKTRARLSKDKLKEMGINRCKMASVDRIDSDKGYTKENTQIVCRFYNLGKTDNSNTDVLELLESFKINNLNSLSIDDSMEGDSGR